MKDAKKELYKRMLKMLVAEHVMQLQKLIDAKALTVSFGGFVDEDGRNLPAVMLALDAEALQREIESQRDAANPACEVIAVLMAKLTEEADAEDRAGLN